MCRGTVRVVNLPPPPPPLPLGAWFSPYLLVNAYVVFTADYRNGRMVVHYFCLQRRGNISPTKLYGWSIYILFFLGAVLAVLYPNSTWYRYGWSISIFPMVLGVVLAETFV